MPTCEVCIQTKMQKARVGHTTQRTEADGKLKPGERFDVDLMGPFPTTQNSRKYALQATDRRTRMTFTSILRSKDEAAEAMARILDRSLTPFGRICTHIHADRGGEFTGQEWKSTCGERGIRYTYAATNTPQHNGLAERVHRTTKRRQHSGQRQYYTPHICATCYPQPDFLTTRAHTSTGPEKNHTSAGY